MVQQVLEGVRGLKGDTGPQGPKGDKGDKGDFGSDGKTAMAADLNMASKKIIHLATPSDAGDAVNKSNKLNKKVINKKTLHKYYHKKLRLFNRAKRGSRH